MKKERIQEALTAFVGRSSIIVFFVVAFEVMIMISPFAFFFYSVFNPIFKWLDHFAATRWLTGFFLPHMILPPTLFLKTIRILGSIFFVSGSLSFFVCAVQVYLGKLMKWGIARKGLYQYVRHPQYLALGLWGIGMSILWPRFIVLASLSFMFVLYYLLAKDEQRRMLHRYGESYERYMSSTGMFFPRSFERFFARHGSRIRLSLPNYVAIPVLIITIVIGSGFMFREITVRSLPIQSKNNITLVSMLPEDDELNTGIINELLKAHADGKLVFLDDAKDYFGYVMMPDYIMQGMIADTGDNFHLFKHHKTFAMITDWVLHPFQHLRSSPATHMAKMHHVDPSMARRHHCPLGINDPALDCNKCPYRRVIIDEVQHTSSNHIAGYKLLAIGAIRVPVAFIDVNTKTGEIVNVKSVGKATAWKDVPTPSI